MANSVGKWVGSIMNDDIVKICAVFLVAAALLKGCDMVEKVDQPTVKGPVPDCTMNKTSNVKINDKNYTLTCKN